MIVTGPLLFNPQTPCDRDQPMLRSNVYCSTILVLCLATQTALAGDEAKPREVIGTLKGESVYRDQIRANGDFKVEYELHRLFYAPLLNAYKEQHKKAVTPTEAELDAAQKYFDAMHKERIADKEAELRQELKSIEQKLADKDLTGDGLDEETSKLIVRKRVLEGRLNPPGRMFAEFMLNNWKFQRHLYEKYGGGRILWQQAGVEAFDAMHKWLKQQEEAGRFTITDPELRTAFYKYWNRSHGAFMTDDKERIQQWLHPEWLPEGSE